MRRMWHTQVLFCIFLKSLKKSMDRDKNQFCGNGGDYIGLLEGGWARSRGTYKKNVHAGMGEVSVSFLRLGWKGQ